MSKSKNKPAKHDDCKNYIPIDVAKGICAHTQQMVINDSECCPKFETVAKCKSCKNYVDASDDGLGTCVGLEDKSFWAYAEMSAKHCPGWDA